MSFTPPQQRDTNVTIWVALLGEEPADEGVPFFGWFGTLPKPSLIKPIVDREGKGVAAEYQVGSNRIIRACASVLLMGKRRSVCMGDPRPIAYR